MGIHNFYLRISAHERNVCDQAAQLVIDKLREAPLPADMADPAERMAEAIARFIFESRGRPLPAPREAPADNASAAGQQVVDFEGIGECFYSHLGMRPAQPGEFYLSGAIVRAYRAPNGTSSPYQIVRPRVRAIRCKAGPWRYMAGEPVTV